MNENREKIRGDLLEIYRAGVRRVRGLEAVRQSLEVNRPRAPVHLVAVGKASSSMTRGAIEALGEAIIDGLVITKHSHLESEVTDDSRFICMESDHPVPGGQTLRAGKALVDFIEERAVKGGSFLFLLSGGASSLVEVLPDDMTLDDLARLNQTLLSAGLDIGQMNQVRRALSRIKGGRLAGWLKGCSVLNLLISDVPGDDPAVVGSGLLTPTREYEDFSQYPEAVRLILEKFKPAAVPDADCFAQIDTQIAACLDDAKSAAADKARSLGYQVKVMPDFLAGDAARAGAEICEIMRHQQGKVLIWGGETSVSLPAKPGRGGRNQHLALAAAIAMRSMTNAYLLSGGTDGTDGPTDDAGGLVDDGTVRRGEQAGYDAGDCLKRADAGSFLEVSGDLLTTGPTGTNVMDLVIAAAL